MERMNSEWGSIAGGGFDGTGVEAAAERMLEEANCRTGTSLVCSLRALLMRTHTGKVIRIRTTKN